MRPSFIRTGRLGPLLLTLAALTSTAHAAGPSRTFEVVLRPETDADRRVLSLVVEEHVSGTDRPRPLSLSAPLQLIGMIPFGVAVSEMSIADESGTVPFQVDDDPPTTDEPARHWRTVRPVSGPTRVRYRLPMQPAGRGGPPYGVKASALGLSGNTSSVLVLPDLPDLARSQLRWDLSGLVSGAQAVATGGKGAFTIEGPPDRLLDRWFMAGPLRAGQDDESVPFQAYTLGSPAFDAPAMMRWAGSVYRVLADRFGYLGQPSYQLLIRTLDLPSYSTGTAARAGGGSLITTGSPHFIRGQSEADLRNTIAHEMGHQWVGQFADGGSLWFAEGLNVYLTSTLPCDAGLQDWSECAAQISKWAQAYYGSEGRTWPQARIEASPFAREDLRLVSYGRGMMFFANLDVALRAASGGQRDLLQALRPLFHARQHGVPLTMTRWEDWLRQTAGAEWVDEFRRSVLQGGLITPAAGAFSSTLEMLPVTGADALASSVGSSGPGDSHPASNPERPVRGYEWRVRAAR